MDCLKYVVSQNCKISPSVLAVQGFGNHWILNTVNLALIIIFDKKSQTKAEFSYGVVKGIRRIYLM